MQFTDKDPDETIRLGVDFNNLLATGETITTATVTVTDADGVDQSTAMVEGAVSNSGGIIRQLIKAGTDGARYTITFQAETDTSQILIEAATLVVRERD